jgi:acetyl esterase/lipase
MSAEELAAIRGILRETDLALAGPVDVARANFAGMLSSLPVDEGLVMERTTLGGVPAVTTPAPAGDRVLLFIHGGAYAVGDAWSYRPLWGPAAAALGATGFAVDYRTAPEHPFPAAVDDGVAAYRALLEDGRAPGSIVVLGDSAGGGLAVSVLVAARDGGLPMPAGVAAISPWADLACAGDSMAEKADADLSLNGDDLRTLATRYLDGASASDPLASAVHADLTGLPPLLVLVGSAEILLDDAVRLARCAAACDVATRLEVWPHMPHDWPLFAAMLGEARQASETLTSWLDERLADGGAR